MEEKHDHFIATKHILRYLHATIYHCFWYTSNEIKVMGYTNSYWGSSETNRRSITSGCFSLGSSIVSWRRKKQDSVALSSIKVEYVIATEVCWESIWLKKFLSNLFQGSLNPTWIHCDNQSCIRFTEETMFHPKKKNINNKYHYIKNLVRYWIVQLHDLPIDEKVAYILNKALPNKKLDYMRGKLGLVHISSPIGREQYQIVLFFMGQGLN